MVGCLGGGLPSLRGRNKTGKLLSLPREELSLPRENAKKEKGVFFPSPLFGPLQTLRAKQEKNTLERKYLRFLLREDPDVRGGKNFFPSYFLRGKALKGGL